ncbi:hypothetical protein STCU_01248 [Strigomonas culicis]|uniref:Palmitoyltransferase n=2 Tax=Strigomonas culicis TaxID=28005 RepID=S9V279_9TRYP|nr:hypothetical protein STCU_03831 [Strigomonas culicis]EPY35104.1 hypothetical protein STCU_01248 [Strigomonas culicis]|eukprot:EPY30872.1 hypothetical protein STCU_03831 [Strigomonas culicis]
MLQSLQHRRVGYINTFRNGRIFIGPDWHLLLTSFVLIFVGSLLFICYTNTITAARVFVSLFSVLSLVFLLLTGLRNPGIAPRDAPPPPEASPREHRFVEYSYRKADGSAAVHKAEQKWCYCCNAYRPPRGIHCRFCDVCVTRRDHHCPWTGICVGGCNYRSYFLLVWSCFGLNLTAFIGGVRSFAARMHAAPSQRFRTALVSTYGIEFVLILFTVFWGLMVGMLAVYHSYLVSQNLTSGDGQRHMPENVFHQGGLFANAKATLCFQADETITNNRLDAAEEIVVTTL